MTPFAAGQATQSQCEFRMESSAIWLILLLVTLGASLCVTAFSIERKILILPGLGLMGVAFAVFFVQRTTVTDKDRLRMIVYDLARQVATNNVEGIVRHVDPNDEITLRRIRTEMPSYTFRSCNVTSLKSVVFDNPSDPQEAIIEVHVFVNVNAPRYDYNGPVRRAVVLEFRKNQDGRWEIVGYRHFDPSHRQYTL